MCLEKFQTVVLPTDILSSLFSPSFSLLSLLSVSASLDVWDRMDKLLPQSRKARRAFQFGRTYFLLTKQNLSCGEALQMQACSFQPSCGSESEPPTTVN